MTGEHVWDWFGRTLLLFFGFVLMGGIGADLAGLVVFGCAGLVAGFWKAID